MHVQGKKKSPGLCDHDHTGVRLLRASPFSATAKILLPLSWNPREQVRLFLPKKKKKFTLYCLKSRRAEQKEQILRSYLSLKAG